MGRSMRLTHFGRQPEYALHALRQIARFSTIPTMDYEIWLRRLGAALRRHREALQAGQEAIADKAGIDQGGLSRIENGKQGFDARTLFALSAALEVSLSALMEETENGTAAKPLTPAALRVAHAYDRLSPADRNRYDQVMQLITSPVARETHPGRARAHAAAEPRASYKAAKKPK